MGSGIRRDRPVPTGASVYVPVRVRRRPSGAAPGVSLRTESPARNPWAHEGAVGAEGRRALGRWGKEEPVLRKVLRRFLPDLRLAHVGELDRSWLLGHGIRHVIFDLENTLVPYRQEKLGKDALRLIDSLRSYGVEVSVVSNSPVGWVARLLDEHGVRYVAMARKPSKKGFLRVAEASAVPASATLHVGDQVITDVLGAHRAGMMAALVDPLSLRGPLTTHLQRWVLVPVLRALCRMAGVGDPLARAPVAAQRRDPISR